MLQPCPMPISCFGMKARAATYATKHGFSNDLKQVARLYVAALPKKSPMVAPRTFIFMQGSQSTIIACDGQRLQNMPWNRSRATNWPTRMVRVTPLLADSCSDSCRKSQWRNTRCTGLQNTLFCNLVRRATIMHKRAFRRLPTIKHNVVHDILKRQSWR